MGYNFFQGVRKMKRSIFVGLLALGMVASVFAAKKVLEWKDADFTPSAYDSSSFVREPLPEGGVRGSLKSGNSGPQQASDIDAAGLEGTVKFVTDPKFGGAGFVFDYTDNRNYRNFLIRNGKIIVATSVDGKQRELFVSDDSVSALIKQENVLKIELVEKTWNFYVNGTQVYSMKFRRSGKVGYKFWASKDKDIVVEVRLTKVQK